MAADLVLALVVLAFLLTSVLPVVLLAMYGAQLAVGWWTRR